MKYLSCFIIFIAVFSPLCAQEGKNIKDEILNLRDLRHLPSHKNAAEIIAKARENRQSNNYSRKEFFRHTFYQKTSVNLIANKDSVSSQINESRLKGGFVFNSLIKPYEPWLEYARPTVYPGESALTMLIYEDYKSVYADNREGKSGSMLHATRNDGFFEIIGRQNITHLLDEMLSDINLYQDESEMILLSFKGPLSETGLSLYKYNLIQKMQVDREECYEIAFYSDNMKENTFAGYLYISTDGTYSLVKSQFTFNNPDNSTFLKNVLLTQYFGLKDGVRIPSKTENILLLGDEVKSSLQVDRVCIYSNFEFERPEEALRWGNDHEADYKNKDQLYWETNRPVPLTDYQAQVGDLLQAAVETPSFRKLQNGVLTLLSNHVTFGGVDGTFELGTLSQFISYNSMEGLRLKVGGNSTLELMNHFLLGGYAAYGTKDGMFKYRGDIIYSLLPRNRYIWEHPKRLISFTYVKDLNIPGQDLLTTNRDNFIYSFSHTATNNMSLQKIGVLNFENEMAHNFSYKLSGKYTYDNPQGVVKYLQTSEMGTTVVNDITTSEVSLSLRYSPREKFIQNRDKRIPIRRGDVEVNLTHRVGIKGLLGSDYDYQITSFKAYKKFNFDNNLGNLDVRFSAGKVWDRIPFPLLFIPEGNQSYIFEGESYNCMNFYEFTTDRFVAGNVNCMINWSPFKLISKKNKIKTSIGSRIIYGSLSDKNNPALHPELFAFNEGVTPLGNVPYSELNIGFANILKCLRVEYVRRLTYLDENMDEDGSRKHLLSGSLFFTGSFSF